MSFKQFHITDTPVQIIRRTIELPVSFESFTENFESRLGRYDYTTLKSSANFADLDAKVATLVGAEPFSIYAIHNHGALIGLIGRSAKAKQYVIGDSRLALKMTQQDIRVALHVPVTLLVYEVGGVAKIEYFTAQSLFGQFGNAQVDQVADETDKKREGVIERVVADSVRAAVQA